MLRCKSWHLSTYIKAEEIRVVNKTSRKRTKNA